MNYMSITTKREQEEKGEYCLKVYLLMNICIRMIGLRELGGSKEIKNPFSAPQYFFSLYQVFLEYFQYFENFLFGS